MKLLGAVLAGGASRRFGSDKALALWRGEPLIAHAVAALQREGAEVVVCGREWGSLPALADLPKPGLGPLGGLCAALQHALVNGFDAVLTAGCDMPGLPAGFAARLAPGPAAAAGQPLLGYWPASLAPMLDAHLASQADRSMRRWVALTRAAQIDLGEIRNINSLADLRE